MTTPWQLGLFIVFYHDWEWFLQTTCIKMVSGGWFMTLIDIDIVLSTLYEMKEQTRINLCVVLSWFIHLSEDLSIQHRAEQWIVRHPIFCQEQPSLHYSKWMDYIAMDSRECTMVFNGLAVFSLCFHVYDLVPASASLKLPLTGTADRTPFPSDVAINSKGRAVFRRRGRIWNLSTIV